MIVGWPLYAETVCAIAAVASGTMGANGGVMRVKTIWLNKPSTTSTWLGLILIYAAFFIFWIVLSKKIYHSDINSFPVRLDTTLSAWQRGMPWQHWFMFFLKPEDVVAGIPYSNMPYFFTFFYAIYHVVINFLTLGRWPYATTYLMTMCALLVASWYILRPMITDFSFRSCVLVLGLASGILVTSPYVSGYLLQFNHDTLFAFNAIAATVLAFAIWRDDGRMGTVVWLSLAYCCISGLLGLVTLGCCFIARRRLSLSNVSWVCLFSFNIFNLLFPMLVSQLVFHQTSASNLLFRTGLDGATDYFTGHWQAFVDPIEPRSIRRALAIKLLVLCALLAIAWWRFRLTFLRETTSLGVALLVYVSHWIIFPQAISIHPYLYDMLFLVPLDIFTAVVMVRVVGRLSNVTNDMVAVIALALIGLLLHDNLLLLAQGKFIGL